MTRQSPIEIELGEIETRKQDIILHADAAEDAHPSPADRNWAMIRDAKHAVRIGADERQVGDAGIDYDLVKLSSIAARVQNAREHGHRGLRQRASRLEVDIAQTSQALTREPHDLRKRDASEIIRMIAASEIQGTDRTAGRQLDGSCPDDRQFDDVAPVTNADQGAGHVHMDTERLASRQRGDHVAEPFECGRLIYRHPEARQKTGNTEPDAPEPVGSSGRGQALQLLYRIAEHCPQLVHRGRRVGPPLTRAVEQDCARWPALLQGPTDLEIG